MKLETFSEAYKMKRVNYNGRDTMLRETTGLFENILIMAQTRQLYMKFFFHVSIRYLDIVSCHS